MANGLRRFWNAITEPTEPIEQEELEYSEEMSTYQETEPERVKRRSQTNNIVNLPSGVTGKMIVYRPVNHEDTRNIIDNLRNRKPVIVNMEQIEAATAQRILDFLSGASYAVGGKLYKVSTRIFIVAPANIDIIGSADGYHEC
ncbi:MAG: cell division protein SepF [Clostridia bacterium]|nr:cell division protein SepF [Clostridia bacterium]